MPFEKVNSHSQKSKRTFDVQVTLRIGSESEGGEERKIDFGKVSEEQLKALQDLFSTIASNVNAIRNMAPLYEKLGNINPSYLQ